MTGGRAAAADGGSHGDRDAAAENRPRHEDRAAVVGATAPHPARSLVLASGSPRRLALLQSIGLSPEVRPVDLDETALPGEAPAAHVERLARAKAAAAGSRSPGVAAEVVLAADTIVALDGHLLGKPADADAARATLRALSGREHEVHTGVAVHQAAGTRVEVVTTTVHFRRLADAEIEWYVATGEPFDKAGAYGIQGAAGVFVEAIVGSASNVIGLPLAETAALLRAAGVWVAGSSDAHDLEPRRR